MKVKYKVVKRRSRMSAMVNGNSKYAVKYIDGARSYADENTLGIFVFETLSAAEDWAWVWNDRTSAYDQHKDLIIIKVHPIGKGKRVRFVAPDPITETLDIFYRDYENTHMTECPNRTMGYPGVHVICEIPWAY